MLWLLLLPELARRFVLVIDLVLALFVWWVIIAVVSVLAGLWSPP